MIQLRPRASHLFLVVILLLPRGLDGQVLDPAPTWAGHVGYAAANAMAGGVIAGLRSLRHGISVKEAFAGGALGGLVIYGGKRLAVEDWATAGLLGRSVASVGASMVRNAAHGADPFETLHLPVLVGRLHADRTPVGWRWRFRPDLTAIVATGYLLTMPDVRLDVAGTLRHGVVLLRTRSAWLEVQGQQAYGLYGYGPILLANHRTHDARATWAHERVHSLQADAFFTTVGEGVERWLAQRFIPQGISTRVDFNALQVVPFWALERGLGLEYPQGPLEMEARFLSGMQ